MLRSFRFAAAEMPNMPSRPVGARMRYPFFQEFAADGIEDEFDAAAVGDLARARFEVFRPVVDEVIDAERPQLGMLGRRKRCR